ncbi:MAG: hypothetical protein LBH43_02195, partial [Treponema sp.]|nr:hypothetical protein [Treponema sp.]
MKLSIRIPLLIGVVVSVISVSLGLLALQISSATLTRSVVGALKAENEANVKLMNALLNKDLDVFFEVANRPRIRT